MYHIPPTEDRICGTCAHWDTRTATHMGLLVSNNLAPCSARAINVDAGDEDTVMVLLGPENHCRAHNEDWEPSKDYLDDRESAEACF